MRDPLTPVLSPEAGERGFGLGLAEGALAEVCGLGLWEVTASA